MPSQTAGHWDLRFFLPGQFEIERASTRPAPKTYMLLYAAALDQYVTSRSDLLSKEPVLTHLLEREFSGAYAHFTHYDTFFARVPPVVDAGLEARVLESFLSSGYNGKLRKEIEDYVSELRRSATPK